MMIYFRGCLTRDKLPQIEKSTRDLLEEAGITYQILEDEGCCGSVLLRTGFQEDAHIVMQETLEKIRGNKVLVSCAGCYQAFKNDYPAILGEEVDVTHTSQLLDQLIREGLIDVEKEDLRVTYHDPCHLGRHTGEYDAPRRVIGSKSELEEMERNREKSRCCGSGGGVRSVCPEKSLEMAIMRLEDARATGAEILVTCCPFCLLNLEDAGDMEVMDLTQFMCEGKK